MKIALGQFAVAPEWRVNLDQCVSLIERAAAEGAGLLILPESIIAADMHDPGITVRTAQMLDGPFVSGLVNALAGKALSVICCIATPAVPALTHNCQIVLDATGVVACYRKLHLYDAFNMKESNDYVPGTELPPIVQVGDIRVGLMTCYDVRFPEVARSLVVRGADLLSVPAAWVRGPGKEWHWEVMVTARALENTCYVAAVGECGPRNIGCSMLVDPMGVAVVRAGSGPDLLFATVDKERMRATREVLPVLANRRFKDPELRAPQE
ncbi:MAG: deaminated glutathione amidase [Acetobacter fabarum]|jgi:predicted amidohydrolase|uniref:deaminated glutathione amidase n=1 Tax=Acetobacter fabarum TaxID=483199 RepID=UPI00242B5DC8|nr:deaminated glutathione amidase [Acetobacter fabarum]MCH4026374.1 deaminated glutathione amidase [Acetobacter fabarum]MCH4055743.1 deaminated glutathione amidase [Acetobacter fabarum]MCH4085764.1 deaminated glutathione amidase [Acetobacter fabarum]MCH4136993.1 deaminated glutathione amidase [Acetobacter fabarum]MCI1323248.1 deaminated glutathione amidase [Acetobacter fabarum]